MTTKTLSQLKSELLKEFKRNFNIGDIQLEKEGLIVSTWRGDFSETIAKKLKSFLSSALDTVAKRTVEAMEIDAPDPKLFKRKTKNNLEVSLKMGEFGWFQAHREQSENRDKWLGRGGK